MMQRTFDRAAAPSRDLYDSFDWSWSARSELLLAGAAVTWAAIYVIGWLGAVIRLAFKSSEPRSDADRDL